MSLTSRAKKLFPTTRNAAKWVQAVRWMRERNLWILENGKLPTWGNGK